MIFLVNLKFSEKLNTTIRLVCFVVNSILIYAVLQMMLKVNALGVIDITTSTCLKHKNFFYHQNKDEIIMLVQDNEPT